ncbi:MAG: methyltransferase domain-containing protein [Planctomycetia bacterium]|nr:methyltransferase domain-containing protein [Planctomycetia bacterium]
MLPRVLEPEVMDSTAEAIDYDAMDHKEVNRTFVDDLVAVCPELLADDEDWLDVLDIGAGTAQIPIELCRRYPRPRVMAIDLAVAMLHMARANVEMAGLVGRVQLDRVDAKQTPYRDGQFALVISNSIVHHIPEPRTVLAEAWRALAPGGLLFIRDLLRPEDDATVNHLVATYAAGANDHQRQMFDDSLRAALSLAEIRDLAVELGLSPDTVRATSDRHWTLAARKGAVP